MATTTQSSGECIAENLADTELAVWLAAKYARRQRVVLVHGDFTCKVLDPDEGSTLFPCDPEGEAKKQFRLLARRSLLSHLALPDQELSQARETAPAWDYAALPVDELNALLATRDGV
ncbi:hypothetical protein, partial [Pseudomonas aeruginosa]